MKESALHITPESLTLTTLLKNEPLTPAELDRLDGFLKSSKGGMAMNLEELDGFFAALIAGLENVMPSEYLPEVLGGELAETCEFEDIEEINEILNLITRHLEHHRWNPIPQFRAGSVSTKERRDNTGHHQNSMGGRFVRPPRTGTSGLRVSWWDRQNQ